MARIRKTITAAALSPDKQWLVAVYIRLSREDGEDESLSVINQKKIIAEYVEQHFDNNHAVVDFYVDDGITGTDQDRPDFKRMIRDIEAGRVNCVICKTLSRAFRNYSDQGYFLEDFFPRYKTRFISIGGPHVDSHIHPEAISGLEVPITGLMNDRYAARTSEDVRRTFNTKRRKGEFIGAFAPYGYSKDPDNKNHLIIDDEAAQTVRDIYRWYVYDGMTKEGIKRHLNHLGIPNPTSYKRGKGLNFNTPKTSMNDGLWDTLTISRFLQNKVYLGHMVQGKQMVVSYKVHDKVSMPESEWFFKGNTHDAIISQALYDQAQDIARRDTRAPSGNNTVYLLSGFVRCADCQKALHRRANNRGFTYYYCRTFEKSKDKCAKHSVREDLLVKAVFAAIQMQTLIVEQLVDTLEKINAVPAVQTKSTRIDALLSTRKQEHDKLRSASSDLYLDWKSGTISKEDYLFMKSKFDSQIEQLNHNIAALEMERKQLSVGIQTKDNPIFTHYLERRTIQELNRGLLASLVDTIFVHADKSITVRFKHADQFERLVAYIDEHKRS